MREEAPNEAAPSLKTTLCTEHQARVLAIIQDQAAAGQIHCYGKSLQLEGFVLVTHLSLIDPVLFNQLYHYFILVCKLFLYIYSITNFYTIYSANKK